MVCKSCGNNNPDGAKFCDNCGAKLEEENVAVETPAADPVAAAFDAANAGAPANAYGAAPVYDYSQQAAPAEPVRGTKWASFLGYFALWLGAIMNFVNAFQVITGKQYDGSGVSANSVYQLFKPLKALDVIYGLLLFVLVAWGVFAAVSIITKKKTTLWAVPFLYVFVAALSLLYTAAATAILGQSCFTLNVIVSILVNICMFFINFTYFRNRKNIYTK